MNTVKSAGLSILLIVLSIALFACAAPVQNNADLNDGTQPPVNDNASDGNLTYGTDEPVDLSYLGKIVFYTSANPVQITSIEDITAALAKCRNDASENDLYEQLIVSVTFASDFTNTDEYKELMAEEIHDWRDKLAKLSADYHSNLYSENRYIVEALKYTGKTESEYSPKITLDIFLSDLSGSALSEVASYEAVTSVTVSYHTTFSSGGGFSSNGM